MPEITWVKILINLFDDEKIKIIDDLPEADAIMVIWLKLILMAGKCNAGGYVYVSEEVPYTEETLSSVLERPLNIVRLALDTFFRLRMVTWEDEGHLYLNNFAKIQNIEGMEKIKQLNRERQRRYYLKHHQPALLEQPNVSQPLANTTDKIRLDKKRIRKEKNIYISENSNNLNTDEAKQLWENVLTLVKKNIGESSFKTWFNPLEAVDLNDGYLTLGSPNEFIATTIERNYRGLLESKLTEAAEKTLSFQLIIGGE